jgi:HSP20 family protein
MVSRWQALNPVWNQLQQLQGGGQVWNQLQALQNEMNRLFDRWSGDTSQGPGFAGTFPSVNVWEDADHLYLEAELPGVEQKELEIYVTGGNQLTLKGQRRQAVPEKGVWHRQERGAGTFSRVLTLPFDVNQDKVDARLEHGILRVALAKHEAAKPRKITVKGE